MPCLLETVRLSKSFGALQAVSNVNLEVMEGSIHSVIGPNGAGKTTLFNLLTGFLKPSAGVIIFNGKEITGLPPEKISKLGVSRSFQITSIFPDLTVSENVRIALQSRTSMSYRFLKKLSIGDGLEERSREVLQQLGLREKADLPAKHLSHGEKRILDIGIGVATTPQLLLLDEPASGLVGDEIARVTNLVKEISSRVTVVLVEHNIDVVLSISDRITVLYYGGIIAEGSPDEIQSNAEVQEVYLGAAC
ncbi:MAG: ABC transporter ATP-binding protein [Syntrophorhabdales bacterium]|jgi:branched-chain amino acid transport system ATP-binding protein